MEKGARRVTGFGENFKVSSERILPHKFRNTLIFLKSTVTNIANSQMLFASRVARHYDSRWPREI